LFFIWRFVYLLSVFVLFLLLFEFMYFVSLFFFTRFRVLDVLEHLNEGYVQRIHTRARTHTFIHTLILARCCLLFSCALSEPAHTKRLTTDPILILSTL
jgi:hypothetical protein